MTRPTRQIGAFEAKNRLCELLVALDQTRVAAAISELRELRGQVQLGDIETVEDLVDEGRRY
jgi:hypothetical protein